MRLSHQLAPALVTLLVLPFAAHAFQAAPAAPNARTGAGQWAGQRPDRFGAITEIKGDVYTLRGGNNTVTVTIPAALPVEGLQGAAASRADLKVGARIGVYGEEKAGAFVATRVRLMPKRGAGRGPGAVVTPPVPVVIPPAAANGRVYPTITIDVSGAPDLLDFANRAKAICETQYHKISEYLKSDGFTPSRSFKFIFREMDGVAYASGNEIHFSAKFFRENPDDYGAAVHEMTHIIQAYKGNNPGWLVEALDDYVRFFRYEPYINVPRANPARVGDSPEPYRVGGEFLNWVQEKYVKDLVPQLNAAMREGRYSDEIWKEKTGKTVNALWAEWKASLKPVS